MGDNHRRYRSISQTLRQLYPGLTGHAARKLNTLAALISGIVGSQRTNFPKIAGKVPDTAKLESRVRRFSRWVQEDAEPERVQVLPFAADLLAGLNSRTLVLVMDTSEVGRSCLALLVSVIYRRRTLPLAWLVVKGSKGHLAARTQVTVLQEIQQRLPQQADVVFLGDGEFDRVELQTELRAFGWDYVCRTARSSLLIVDDEEVSWKDLLLEPGDHLLLPEVLFTRQRLGPLQVIAWWRCEYPEPLFLVTNLETLDEACYWYRKRFRIETFFSDQKRRGFHLHKSHLANPERIGRLMIAACLAYIWMIYLGVRAKEAGYLPLIHRTDRCDLSLFQLGLRLLDHLLDHDEPIPVAFTVPLKGFVR